MAFGHGPLVVYDNLLLSVDPADKSSYIGSGNILYDLSGNNNNFTFNPSLNFDSANGGNIVANSISGSTANFKGVSAGSNITNNTTNEVWYRWNGVNQASLISTLGNIAFSGYTGMYINDGTNAPNTGNRVSVIFGGQSYSVISTGTLFATLVSNRWTQIVITRDTTTTKLYQDGIFLGSTTLAITNYTAAAPYTVNTQALTNGNISICRLYNRALTDSEIFRNYEIYKGRFDR